jgi:hypothetical protein
VVQYAGLSPGGRVVIAGNFELVNETPRWKLARLNADGTLDNGFVPPPDRGAVNSVALDEDEYHRLAVQADGKVLAYSRRAFRFQRLNADGSPDASFNPPQLNGFLVNGEIALQPDGKILLPDTTAGVPRVWLVRLNPRSRANRPRRQDQSEMTVAGKMIAKPWRDPRDGARSLRRMTRL